MVKQQRERIRQSRSLSWAGSQAFPSRDNGVRRAHSGRTNTKTYLLRSWKRYDKFSASLMDLQDLQV